MPSQRVIDLDVLGRRRQWRAQIARSRRRIGTHVRGVARETRALLNWRTYVRRYPAAAVMSAATLGLMLARRGRRSAAARQTAPGDDPRRPVGRGAGVWLLRELMSGLSHLGVAWLSREFATRASAAQDAALAAALGRAAAAVPASSPPSSAESSPPAARKRTTKRRTGPVAPGSSEADT